MSKIIKLEARFANTSCAWEIRYYKIQCSFDRKYPRRKMDPL